MADRSQIDSLFVFETYTFDKPILFVSWVNDPPFGTYRTICIGA
jgi:hypothetical protein